MAKPNHFGFNKYFPKARPSVEILRGFEYTTDTVEDLLTLRIKIIRKVENRALFYPNSEKILTNRLLLFYLFGDCQQILESLIYTQNTVRLKRTVNMHFGQVHFDQ